MTPTLQYRMLHDESADLVVMPRFKNPANREKIEKSNKKREEDSSTREKTKEEKIRDEELDEFVLSTMLEQVSSDEHNVNLFKAEISNWKGSTFRSYFMKLDSEVDCSMCGGTHNSPQLAAKITGSPPKLSIHCRKLKDWTTIVEEIPESMYTALKSDVPFGIRLDATKIREHYQSMTYPKGVVPDIQVYKDSKMRELPRWDPLSNMQLVRAYDANMGGQKTTAIKKDLKYAREDTSKFVRQSGVMKLVNPVKILAVGPNILNCDKFASEDCFNLFHYKNHKGGFYDEKELVVTLESFRKIDRNMTYDILILDEVYTIMRKFGSKTMKGKQNDCWSAFLRILANAKMIILADGDLQECFQTMLDWIILARKKHNIGNELKIEINCRIVPLPWEINIITEEEDMYKIMSRMLTDKKHFAVLSTNVSKFWQKAEQTIEDQYTGKAFLKIHSKKENLDGNIYFDKETKETIKNLEKNAPDLDYLLASPTMNAGISLENHKFDAVFVLAKNESVDHHGLLQMMGRPRATEGNPIIRYYLYVKQNSGSRETNPSVVREAIKSKMFHYMNLDEFKGYSYETENNELFDHLINVRCQRNASLNGFKKNLMNYFSAQGIKPKYPNVKWLIEAVPFLIEEPFHELPGFALKENQYCHLILEAKPITQIEADRIKAKVESSNEENRRKFSRDDQMAMERFYLEKEIGLKLDSFPPEQALEIVKARKTISLARKLDNAGDQDHKEFSPQKYMIDFKGYTMRNNLCQELKNDIGFVDPSTELHKDVVIKKGLEFFANLSSKQFLFSEWKNVCKDLTRDNITEAAKNEKVCLKTLKQLFKNSGCLSLKLNHKQRHGNRLYLLEKKAEKLLETKKRKITSDSPESAKKQKVDIDLECPF